MIVAAVVPAQHCAVLPGDEAAQSFQRSIEADNRVGFLEDFGDLFVFQIRGTRHHPREEAAFADRTDHFPFAEDWQIFDMVFLHEFEGFGDRLVGSSSNEPCCSATCDNVLERFYVHESSFHHPLVIVNLTYIPAAVIMQDYYDKIILLEEILELHQSLYGGA